MPINMKLLFVLIIVVFLTKATNSSNLFDLNPDGIIRSFYSTRDFILDDSLYEYNDSITWSTIYVAVMDNNQTNGFVQLELQTAINDLRLTQDFANFLNDIDAVTLTTTDITYLNSLSSSFNFINGMKFTQTITNTTRFILGVFNSIAFDFNEVDDFNPRTICIFAMDINNETTCNCVEVEYIGNNGIPVILTYTPLVNEFFEGSDAIQVLNGNLTVQHDDHPSYLLQELKVDLVHTDNVYESLSLNISNQSVVYTYDPIEGELIVTVPGTTAEYTEYMNSVLYSNLNPEPLTENRTITFTVSDGYTLPNEIDVNINVVNTNDPQVFVFSTAKLEQYTEGNGMATIDSGLIITDADADPMIESVNIQLMVVDFGNEYLLIDPSSNLFNFSINNSQTSISVTGKGNLTEYAAVLRSLTYSHNDNNPGNPTMGNRTLEFIVYDGSDTFVTQINFEVIPVNDAPILLIVDNVTSDLILIDNTTKQITYTEDDPALFIATDIYLQDVDSNISSVTIDFPNENGDMFQVDNYLSLQGVYSLQSSMIDNTMVISGNASAEVYQEIIRSLYYLNTIENNTIPTGIRTVFIIANDTFNAQSETVSIDINVQSRNDEPEIVINDILQFEEGSTSIEIATPHILSLMDEEQHGISKLTVSLVGVNGGLDEEDSLALRIVKTNLLETLETNHTYISTSDPGTVQDYEEFLRSIRYINEAVEPTYYLNLTSKELLERRIVIEITDDGPIQSTAVYTIMINITLRNDEKPVIRINLVDTGCSATYPESLSPKYSKRDTSSINRLHRRLQNKRRSNIAGLAPAIAATYAQTSSIGTSCISNITVAFSTDTNVPPVEFKRDLSEVISLLPATLNSLVRYGRWMDHKTLIISLTKCYEVNDANASGLKVIFEPTKGGDSDCNTTSKCTDGICFRNSTGCPIAGFSSIMANITPSLPSGIPSVSPDPSYSSSVSGFSLIPYIGIILTAIVIIVLFMCGVRYALSSKQDKTTSLPYEFDEIKCSTVKEVQTLIPQHADIMLSKESVDDKKAAVITDEVLNELKEQYATPDDGGTITENETITASCLNETEQKCRDCVLQLPVPVVQSDEAAITTNSSLRRLSSPQGGTNDHRHSNGQIRTLVQLDSKDR